MPYRFTILSFLIACAAGCTTERTEAPPAQTEPRTESPTLADRAARAAEQTRLTAPGPAPRQEAFAKQAESEGARARHHLPGADVAGIVQPLIRAAGEPLYRERYEHPGDHRVLRVSEHPVSTFSIDVDTGSYSNMRRWLDQGQLPPEDAVRVEEFVNYFDYAYAAPERPDTPFVVHSEIAPTPWNPQTHLLQIGIQGYRMPADRRPHVNLVFLVDVSGSMRSNDKLPLLRNALGMLVRQLGAEDSIGLVVYAGASGVVLEPTRGDRHAEITAALQRLEAGGSTNGAAGIRLAYRMARQNFHADGVNRVILATDGDFNVGLASTDELIDLIEREREGGVALTTLGFGSGNYNDHLLERLADAGDGNYAYIDRLAEARKVLAEEMTATLMTIARDVKLQIEFNPENVAEYRLIGYENRVLDEEDFDNDRVDAGEIGAGHRVTALYEISLTDSGYTRLRPRRYGPADQSPSRRSARDGLGDELAHLRIRYKRPGDDRSRLIERPLLRRSILPSVAATSDDFRFAAAVAAFGQKLRGGEFLEGWSWDDIAGQARNARGADPFGYRGEFLQLVALAGTLAGGDRVADH